MNKILLADHEIDSGQRLRSRGLTRSGSHPEILGRLETELLSFIRHELRTPLRALAAFDLLDSLGSMAALDLLDPSARGEEQARASDLLRHGCVRLSRFLECALEHMNSSSRGKVTAERVDLARILRNVCGGIPALRDPDVSFEVRSDGSPAWILGWKAGLTVVVRSLLENALDHSPNRKQIVARLHTQGDRVALSISDRGAGLAAGELEDVFRLFASADVDRDSAGRGFSLALAKWIVQSHGGTLRVESRGANEGSMFTLELPTARSWNVSKT